MSNLIPFSFDSQEIRVLTDDSGEPLFVAKDVAAALGYADPTTAIKSHCRGVQELHPIPDSSGVLQNFRVIREPDLYRLVFGSTLPSAQTFERWVVEEVLPTIRKTGGYSVPHLPLPYQPDPELQIAELAARMLRLSDTSKLRMLSALCDQRGVSPRFLPSYVDEPLVRSLTALLREHHVDLSAPVANRILVSLGLVEELERKGSRGEIKRFKSLTEAGLKYGRNETSPQNPRETQPLYYVARFPELLGLILNYLDTGEAA